MFQAQNRENRETLDSARKVAISFKIIMTTSHEDNTRPSCFTTHNQTCKTKTETDFLVWDWSCPTLVLSEDRRSRTTSLTVTYNTAVFFCDFGMSHSSIRGIGIIKRRAGNSLHIACRGTARELVVADWYATETGYIHRIQEAEISTRLGKSSAALCCPLCRLLRARSYTISEH